MDASGILLTGGIGSGKSTAAGMLAARGAAVVSADDAAREVLEPGGAAWTAVAVRWPEAVSEGKIDRRRLAEIVFGEAASLAELEAITHPEIRRVILARIELAAGAPLVVVEVPLPTDPVDRGWPVVVVDAPDETRRARLVERGMSLDDVRARMAVQPSRSEWLGAADRVLDNGGDLAALDAACGRLWRDLTDS
jgi:dephospho-CoA kinase